MKCKTYNTECKRSCTDKCACENSYRPSNGSEGMWFTERFCEQCIHDNPDPNSKKKCDILTATMFLDPYEPGYPNEWIYDKEGKPTCTKFVKWDWNKNGDPDDPDNPLAPPPPPDPNQLNLFPLYPDEKTYSIKQMPAVVSASSSS